MRKLLLCFLLLVPALASAEVQHTRSFDGPVDSSLMVVDIVVDSYEEDINCGGLAFWGIQAIEHETGSRFPGSPRFVSSAVLSKTFTLDLPQGDFEELTFICSDDGENEAFQFGSIENDIPNDQVIFEVSDNVVPVVSEDAEDAVSTSITFDFSDGQTVTASIDGVAASTSPQSMDAETGSSQTAAVAEATGAEDGMFDTIAEKILDIIGVDNATETNPTEAPAESGLEESAPTSSVSGDANTNGTTTATF
mgnify:CR=1 FL=1